MDGSTALISTILALCALIFTHARGVKAGRALLEPQLKEKDRLNGEIRAEMDGIIKSLEVPAVPFAPPVKLGERFQWCGVRMICTGHMLQTTVGPLDCVRAEYACRDGVVRTHTFAGVELDALRIELSRAKDIQSRSIFSEFPFPLHQEEQST